jgi:VWFA-related protein
MLREVDMQKAFPFWPRICVFAAGLAILAAVWAAGSSGVGNGSLARIILTVRTRPNAVFPAFGSRDIRVYEGNQRRPVVSCVAISSEASRLDLTLLMDDSIKATIGLQYRDLANFLPALPAGTRVRVAYASYGGNEVAQDFTSDFGKVRPALRLPVGSSMAGGSIYQSVVDLMKKWPQDDNRRALLVISDGIDINQGFEESLPEFNMELQQAIDLAQKTNVTVYTIFARGENSLESNMFLLNNGQSCLLRLSTETGGQSYFQGTYTPLAFAPYLAQFANDLHHQYILTFKTSPGKRSGYQPLRVATEAPDIKLSAPARVFVSKAEEM